MSNKAIWIENVRKSFQKRPVLDGVSGAIETGKVVGLLARNGAGKTTLFRILLDILAADSGNISICGHHPDGSGRIRLHVGYVPERPQFHPFHTVGKVLKFRSAIFPRWNAAKTGQLLKDLQLNVDTPIAGASKGTVAKLAWICATAHDPGVLLLDEPTSGLDALVRDSVLTHLISEIAAEGKTVFLTNHRMEEMATILDELWVLSRGKIAAQYSIEDLRQNAVRVTGRLKNPEAVLPGLSVLQEQRTGPVVEWVLADKSSVERLQTQSFLDQMETESMPVETLLKLLLPKQEEPYVR